MKKILDYLEQLDLSEIEAKLYLALLESGSISVRELAELIGIKRTTVYAHIDLLIEKGLVTKVVKGSHKQVAANPANESLQYLAEKKLDSAKKAHGKLPDILKTINTELPEFKHTDDAEI